MVINENPNLNGSLQPTLSSLLGYYLSAVGLGGLEACSRQSLKDPGFIFSPLTIL